MTDEIFGPLFPIARFSEIEDVVQFCRKLPTGKPLALYLYRSLRLRTIAATPARCRDWARPRHVGAGTDCEPSLPSRSQWAAPIQHCPLCAPLSACGRGDGCFRPSTRCGAAMAA
jgi:hypothetical protein